MIVNLSSIDFPVSVGVWGLGRHAQRTILPAIAQVDGLKLAGIAARRKDVTTQLSEVYGTRALGTLDELLAIKEIDAVIVATPIGCHYEDATRILLAGKHLWCEKSLTADMISTRDLLDKAVASDLTVSVVCSPLYHPLFGMLLDRTGQLDIGAVRSIDAHFGFPHVSGDDPKYDPQLDGSALLDVGYYPIVIGTSLIRHEIDLVSAVMETEQGFEIDTRGSALFRSSQGAHVITRWGYGQDYVNEIRIVGETGVIEASPAFSKPDNIAMTLRIRRQQSITDIPVPKVDQYASMLANFAVALRDRESRMVARKTTLRFQLLLDTVQSQACHKQGVAIL